MEENVAETELGVLALEVDAVMLVDALVEAIEELVNVTPEIVPVWLEVETEVLVNDRKGPNDVETIELEDEVVLKTEVEEEVEGDAEEDVEEDVNEVVELVLVVLVRTANLYMLSRLGPPQNSVSFPTVFVSTFPSTIYTNIKRTHRCKSLRSRCSVQALNQYQSYFRNNTTER